MTIGILALASTGCGVRSEDARAPRPLVLNEVMASNRGGARDEDGRSSDWIEIHNPGALPADLGGFTISDDPAAAGKWKFPPVTVPPGGHLRLWASGKDRHTMPERTLRKLGSTVPFDRTFIKVGDRWRYLVAEPGGEGPPPGWAASSFDDASFSQGRSGFGYEDGDDATVLSEGTTAVFLRRRFLVEDPGRVGQLVLRIDYDDGFVAYLNGTRVASANSPVPDPDFDSIATSKHEPGKVECFDLTPHAGKLVAGENVLAIVGLNDRPSTDMSLIPELGTFAAILHASFELGAAGGEVVLTGPDGTLVDRMAYPRQAEDRSFGRTPDGGDRIAFFLTPTPGAANRTRPFEEPPSASISFSPAPGFHASPLEVEIRLEAHGEGIALRSTLDGSPPAPSSRIAGPIQVASSTVVRAAAFLGDEEVTPARSASYFVGSPPPLPVLSISMAPRDFEETHLDENAHGIASERPAYLEVFAPDGTRAAATGVGFRLHGGYGRRGDLSTKKSYRLYFRPAYGDAEIAFPWIPGLDGKALDRLVLRSGFNDRLGAYHPGATFLRDQVIRDLHRDMGAPVSGGSWCLILVNAEWKGIYNVVERLDEEFLRRHLGPGDWDMVKTGEEVVCGTKERWDELKRLVAGRNFASGDRYGEVARNVDLEAFTAYFILNCWAQNEDWPQNNWYAARRAGPDSKWIFLSWDAEWGLGLTPAGYRSDSLRAMLSRKEKPLIRDLFVGLLENAEYRAYFRKEVNRHLEGALRSENVARHIARNARAIRVAIPAELDANAPGFTADLWERNVESLGSFAVQRGPYFRRLVESWLSAASPEVSPLVPR